MISIIETIKELEDLSIEIEKALPLRPINLEFTIKSNPTLKNEIMKMMNRIPDSSIRITTFKTKNGITFNIK